MKIVITGASGYIGSAIATELKKRQHQVMPVKRDLLYGAVGDLKNVLRNSDVVINLAGASIMQRWTKQNKKTIYDSRIKTTANIVEATEMLPPGEQPEKFISASAVGIYKSGYRHDETSLNYDESFVGKVVKDWESASDGLPGNVNRVIFRTGLVLGRDSKIIKNMLLPFKLGLGATIGNGKQPFPFIHINDVVSAFASAVENTQFTGIYNLVAPESVTNKDFTKEFATQLNRPAYFRIPAPILKLAFGEAAVMLLCSPEVVPHRLLNMGFNFISPTLKETVKKVLL